VVPGESKNVISQNIGFAVVLMKPAMGRSVNHIALDQDAAAAFVEVNPPTPVTKSGDVVPKVIDDPGSRLFPQRVDAPHIAKDWAITIRLHADVMNVVLFDQIIPGGSRAISPGPSD
jgi:hypothetical protein